MRLTPFVPNYSTIRSFLFYFCVHSFIYSYFVAMKLESHKILFSPSHKQWTLQNMELRKIETVLQPVHTPTSKFWIQIALICNALVQNVDICQQHSEPRERNEEQNQQRILRSWYFPCSLIGQKFVQTKYMKYHKHLHEYVAKKKKKKKRRKLELI